MKALGMALLGLSAAGTYYLCSHPDSFSGMRRAIHPERKTARPERKTARPERKTARARILMAAKGTKPDNGEIRVSAIPGHGMNRPTARAWNRAAFEHPALRRVREDW